MAFMQHIGAAGEHIVCADLILRGYSISMSSAGLPYDVIAEIDGRLLRLAVRSTIEPRRRLQRADLRKVYQFNIVRCGEKRLRYDGVADIVAVVGLDIRAVGYLSAAECPKILHLDVPGEGASRGTRHRAKGSTKSFAEYPLEAALRKVWP